MDQCASLAAQSCAGLSTFPAPQGPSVAALGGHLLDDTCRGGCFPLPATRLSCPLVDLPKPAVLLDAFWLASGTPKLPGAHEGSRGLLPSCSSDTEEVGH